MFLEEERHVGKENGEQFKRQTPTRVEKLNTCQITLFCSTFFSLFVVEERSINREREKQEVKKERKIWIRVEEEW